MKKLALCLAAASALALSACETATPYQPLGLNHSQASGGYSEYQVEPNRWTVSFSGNDLTARQTVEKYLLFRAAELSLAQGFDWFTTVERNTERKSSTYGVGDPFFAGAGYFGPSYGLYGRRFGGWRYGYGGYGGFGGGFGGGGFGYGFGYGPGSFDVQEIDRYRAQAEIVMGRGRKPFGDPRAFDARAVIDHLGPTIQRPRA